MAAHDLVYYPSMSQRGGVRARALSWCARVQQMYTRCGTKVYALTLYEHMIERRSL